MPSINDPFPLAIIEAFAAGVPVIASASGGHPEAIEDGKTGLLFAPGDSRDLARMIERLAADPDLRAHLASQARERAVREYSEDALPERISALYSSVLRPAAVPDGCAHNAGLSQSRPPFSVLIPCFNNEDIMEDCLRSVGWAEEVVVCDSFSTDRTLEIAERHADRIIQHRYENSASQKNWVLPRLSHDWVLIVDTDEWVSPALRAEIERVLAAPGGSVGFRIPRANYLFGRWLRYGGNWPDYQVRLFRRVAGRYEAREVHAHVLLDGPCGTLDAPLLHYPHRSMGNLRRVLLQRYTTWEAAEKRRQGVRFGWRDLLIRPPGAFVYRYLYRQGFRDGWQGLFMALVWTAYVFITYLKLRRLEGDDRS